MPSVPFHDFMTTQEACPHCWSDTDLKTPTFSVNKDDCCYCFNTTAHGIGLLVCMTCHEAVCADHADLHRQHTSHCMYVKIMRLPDHMSDQEILLEIEKMRSNNNNNNNNNNINNNKNSNAMLENHHNDNNNEDDNNNGNNVIDGKPMKSSSTSLQSYPIGPPTSTDVNMLGVTTPPVYDYRMLCLECCVFFTTAEIGVAYYSFVGIKGAASMSSNGPAIDGIDNNNNNNNNNNDDPWRNSIICPHTQSLVQIENPYDPNNNKYTKMPSDTSTLKCAECPCSKNNWMCMTCGIVGCPRTEAGGQRHAIYHYEKTGHPVVLKLGTVTNKGADLYCYACDTEVKDPNIKAHLEYFTIDMNTAIKTSKTIGEMTYDISTQHDYRVICEVGEDGTSQLVPVYGPGFTGMKNFGNSCYMSSVLQVLLSTRQFREYFGNNNDNNNNNRKAGGHNSSDCARAPRKCFGCQWEKLANGVFSGKFSKSEEEHYSDEGSMVFSAGLCSPAVVSHQQEVRHRFNEELMKVIMAAQEPQGDEGSSGQPNEKDQNPFGKLWASLVQDSDDEGKQGTPQAAASIVRPRRPCHSIDVLNGLTPRDMKCILANGNKDFLSGRQQDAQEFLTTVLALVDYQAKASPAASSGGTSSSTLSACSLSPVTPFEIETIQKKQCLSCSRVAYDRYREHVLRLPNPVNPSLLPPPTDDPDEAKRLRPKTTLDALISTILTPTITNCQCDDCGDTSSGRLETFCIANLPELLILNVNRGYFDRSTMSIKKMDVAVEAPSEFDFSSLKGVGIPQDGEVTMKSHVSVVKGVNDNIKFGDSLSDVKNDNNVAVDEVALVTLISMGIEQKTAEWALKEKNNNIEQSIDFVFSNPDGPPNTSVTAEPKATLPLSPLTDTTKGTKYKLVATMSHVGASALTGHYLCHILRDGQWYAFNDDKVGRSLQPPLNLASMYLYSRV